MMCYYLNVHFQGQGVKYLPRYNLPGEMNLRRLFAMRTSDVVPSGHILVLGRVFLTIEKRLPYFSLVMSVCRHVSARLPLYGFASKV